MDTAQSHALMNGGELDEVTQRHACAGSETAFRVLVEFYQARVFAWVGKFLGNRYSNSVVEEISQDVFLGVFRSLPTFKPMAQAKLSTWILTIATRRSLTFLRDQSRRVQPSHGEAPLASGPWAADEGSKRRRLNELIAGCLDELPHEQRITFVLRELHEMDHASIASVLKISEGTVKSRLARTRLALRARLQEVSP